MLISSISSLSLPPLRGVSIGVTARCRRQIVGHFSPSAKVRNVHALVQEIGQSFIATAHPSKLGCEGIVSKRRGSHYRSGRSTAWVKIKNPTAPAVRREAEEEWRAWCALLAQPCRFSRRPGPSRKASAGSSSPTVTAAVCILIGVMVVIVAYEWSEGNKGGGQQTAAAHHSIRSLVGGDSGSGGSGG
jgi:hypothetical protein